MLVFDSNILIYYLNGIFASRRRGRVKEWVRQGASVSVVTRIEVLGFEQFRREQNRARTFLALFQEVPLENEIVEETISIRREHSIGVPDAITDT